MRKKTKRTVVGHLSKRRKPEDFEKDAIELYKHIERLMDKHKPEMVYGILETIKFSFMMESWEALKQDRLLKSFEGLKNAFDKI